MATWKGRNQTQEQLNVLKDKETSSMVALYTLSAGKRSICVQLPIDSVVEHMREYLEEMR